ncbi:MAG: 1-(5-phosphoribosyl)-5-[(5-phosphoribosylamino)methylideneamino]imidazole-4-carboxamide isomerase [bacterium]|nr:1-(5-phosphoribosyl)-5-[(5-phosphoribosylamino)methylideneamino]imidazole-4-carboxamide isomerase [bacterium]
MSAKREANERFDIIPAVDLLGGQVVRLYKGDYDQSTVYGDDPAAPIRAFLEAGAELIHVVDLDAARNGDRGVNAAAIQKILTVLREFRDGGGRALLEVGGGIRDLGAIDEYIAAGVDRCIIGTAAVKDPEFVTAAVAKHGGERVIVGVDALDGVVRVSGWEESSGLQVADFVRDMQARGVAEIIFTDISRDGALTGPPIDALRHVLAESKARVIASGGVATLADVQALLDLKASAGGAGLVGVISGKAIYEKKLDLDAAVKLCRGH